MQQQKGKKNLCLDVFERISLNSAVAKENEVVSTRCVAQRPDGFIVVLSSSVPQNDVDDIAIDFLDCAEAVVDGWRVVGDEAVCGVR